MRISNRMPMMDRYRAPIEIIIVYAAAPTGASHHLPHFLRKWGRKVGGRIDIESFSLQENVT
jgi:hypothetical protein